MAVSAIKRIVNDLDLKKALYGKIPVFIFEK